MTTRLVTFLGLGDGRAPDAHSRYGRGRFDLDGCVTPPTWNHDVAAAMRYRDVAAILVLGTEEVRRAWFEETDAYREELRRCGFDGFVGFAPIPSGRTAEERWEIFAAIGEALKPSAISLAAPRGEREAEAESPATIVLDITHGFRSQPFFAASAVAFTRVVPKDEALPERLHPEVRILYSAWEARESGDAGPLVPVWDLTQFLRVIEWTSALSSMMRHGRGDELERLLRDTQRAAMTRAAERNEVAGGLERRPPPGFQKLGTACRNFADGLATARIPDLSTRLADHLSRTIDEVKEGVCREVPPLRASLEELQDWCRPLSAGAPVGIDGLRAGVELARRYVRMERYLEAAVALRETVTSAWCVATSAEPYAQPGLAGKPGRGAFTETRRDHERELGRRAWGPARTTSPAEEELLATYREIGDLRNDVEHGGFNAHPRGAAVIRSALVSAVSKLEGTIEALFAGPRPFQAPEGGRRPFVNLSNHPVEAWPQAQLAAARALGAGEPLDFPGGFPSVDPEAGAEEVDELAERTVAEVAGMDPAVVFVSGEFTLTHALVAGLRSKGVRCVAATTRRAVSESARPDGSVVRTSRFEFVRWREYSA